MYIELKNCWRNWRVLFVSVCSSAWLQAAANFILFSFHQTRFNQQKNSTDKISFLFYLTQLNYLIRRDFKIKLWRALIGRVQPQNISIFAL
jgi:hypothetical protein